MTYKKQAARNGTIYLGRSYGSKVIAMPFYIKGDVYSKYDALLAALNVSEPKPLAFSNIENRYFMAFPDGKVEFRLLAKMLELVLCRGRCRMAFLTLEQS